MKGYRYGPQYIPMGGLDENILKLISEPVNKSLIDDNKNNNNNNKKNNNSNDNIDDFRFFACLVLFLLHL